MPTSANLDLEVSRRATDAAMAVGASYADCRQERQCKEYIAVDNRRVDRVLAHLGLGIGIRVIADGAWGFQSAADLGREKVVEAARRAVRLAKAAAKISSTRVELAPSRVHSSRYAPRVRIPLPDVPLDDKVRDMLRLSRALRSVGGTHHDRLAYSGMASEKLFLSSEGTEVATGSSVLCVTMRVDSQNAGTRAGMSRTLGGSGGYDLFESHATVDDARDVARDATLLARCGRARHTKGAVVVVHPSLGSLFCHELVGHPTEADRVLGRELAWGGGTWWGRNLGARIGSNCLNVSDDPTLVGIPGSYRFDDEGVPARRRRLVSGGIVTEYIHSRETAHQFGVEPNGGMRAASFECPPLIRVSNTFFEPGDRSTEEIVASVRAGYLISDWRQPSIDERRSRWSISAYGGWRIEKGEITCRVRDVTLQGTAPEFFASVDAVSKECRVGALSGLCGKGDPLQPLFVGGGGAWVRGRADVV